MISSSKAFHDAVIKQTLPESDEPDNDEGVNELNAEFIEADSDEESLNEQNSSDNGRATLLSTQVTKPSETVCLRSNRRSQRVESNENPAGINCKLDSVRFSMYTLQNSQLSEIDALLNELNHLQTSLDYPDPSSHRTCGSDFIDNQMKNSTSELSLSASLYFNGSTTPLNNNLNAHSEDIEAIDQQFDEVLKFLAQSIDSGYKTAAAPAAATTQQCISSHSSISLNNSDKRMDTELSGSGSSNSSGIGDDFYTSQNTEALMTQQKQLQNSRNLKVSLNGEQTKRNSSDSAFMDAMSMPSSLSLTTNRNLNQPLILSRNKMFMSSLANSSESGSSSEPSPVSSSSEQTQKHPTPQEEAEAKKAELIRVALENLKEANIRKLIVKAYTDDGCTKSVIIDETMKIYDVMLMLFNKNHSKPSVKYSVVEYLPKFHMERIFEDHENLVDAMSNWSRDSENQIIFTEKEAKYDIFLRPEFYLLNEANAKSEESQRNKLINEFFQNIGSPVPEVEGLLHFKIESKKSWKKFYCVLRQSGLYYIPKGKNKKDLQCLFNFDKLDLYYGLDWKKEFKSPTDFTFALKYPQVQKKSSKYIKYVCCDTEKELKRWFNGIRIAKFGKQLFDNYKQALELIEMSKVSGRLPNVINRRLSASVSNQNIYRPKSSYSLISNGNLDNCSQFGQTETVANSVRNSYVTLEQTEETNSANNRNQTELVPSSLLIRQESPKEAFNFNNYKHNPNQPNVSYTDQLKSLLQAHQIQKEAAASTESTANTGFMTRRTESPVNAIRNKAKLPLTTDLTKHMLNLNSFTLTSSMAVSQPQDSDTLMRKKEKPEPPQRVLDMEQKNEVKISFISEAKFDINETEFPSPPIEIFEEKTVFRKAAKSLCEPPAVAPKPVFKRFNSCSAEERDDKRERVPSRVTEQRVSLAKSRSSQPCTQPNELINELSSILARQKKKIEDATESQSINQHISAKPPPPPRPQRQQPYVKF